MSGRAAGEWAADEAETARVLREIIRDLTAEGFEAPYRFLLLSRTGHVVAGWLTPNEAGLTPTFSVEPPVGEELVLPLHLLVVDDREQAAHFLLEHTGLRRVLH